MESIYNRTEILLGKESVNTLKLKHVMVCGIGGVGSYALEALARIGIGKITIVDKDVIDITNINRQLLALNSTIGKDKVEVAKKRISDINNKIVIDALKLDINKNNVEELILNKNIDYVVDSVDNVEAKIAIIDICHKNNIKCISCMGTANKINPLELKIADIYKTNTCPLAKIIRKRLKEINIKKQKVLFSTELPKKNSNEQSNNILGSVSFVPSAAGIIIASEVVKDLLDIK